MYELQFRFILQCPTEVMKYRSYEMTKFMNYRSYELNSLTKSTNLRLTCDRSYEVTETIDFSEDQMFG